MDNLAYIALTASAAILACWCQSCYYGKQIEKLININERKQRNLDAVERFLTRQYLDKRSVAQTDPALHVEG